MMSGRPLDFCMITTFYPPYSFGGDAVYTYRLANLLARAGHRVDVIHCVDSFHIFQPRPEAGHFPQEPGVQVHRLESGLGALSPLISHQTGLPVFKSAKISAILASRCFDVIHYHNISLLGPGVLEIDPPYGGCVKLYTMHEHWLICPTNVLWKFNSRPCEKAQCLACTLKARRPPQWWRYTSLRDRTAARVDRFLSPSAFTRDIHKSRGFPYPIEVLPHFLDRVAEDGPEPLARPHVRPYFLFAGRLEKIKGLHNVISEFAGEGHSDLVIAGSGTYGSELRKLAEGMPRVHFVGWQPANRLGSYYRHALAVLVPSVTYETFGLAVIEAFARRTPAIVNDLGALPELVRQSGGGGFIYENSDGLRLAIAALEENPSLRDRTGEKGYQSFERHWSQESHLKNYLRVVGEASARKRGLTVEEELHV